METNNSIIVTSRVRLARNVDKTPFPHKLRDKNAFDGIIKFASQTADKLFPYKLLLMSQMDGVNREALVEKHLISRDLVQNTESGAVLLSDDETVSVMLNEEDHFRIQSIRKGEDLEGAFKAAKQFDRVLGDKVMLAYSDRYGYLTACPTNVGTGMRASVMLFLPALTINKSISSIIVAVQKLGLTVRGVYGEGSRADGCMYQLSNRISLGITEQEILDSVAVTAQTIENAELEARSLLLSRRGITLKDELSRAYGVLKSACILTSAELNELLTKVKLGVALGIINADGAVLDKLSVDCLPANMTIIAGHELSEIDRDAYRAEYVKKILK